MKNLKIFLILFTVVFLFTTYLFIKTKIKSNQFEKCLKSTQYSDEECDSCYLVIYCNLKK